MRQTYFINLCHQPISLTYVINLFQVLYYRYFVEAASQRPYVGWRHPCCRGRGTTLFSVAKIGIFSVTHVIVDEVRRLPKQHWNIQCGDIGIFSVVGSEKMYTEKIEKASPCYAEI